MAEPVEYLAQALFPLHPFLALAFRLLLGLVAGAAAGAFLTCVGFAVAQCCKGERRRSVTATIIVVAALAGDAALTLAQEVPVSGSRVQGPVPELHPSFERLFGSDSLMVSVDLRQGNVGLGITPSPDGRWLLFGAEGSEAGGIWLASAQGGDFVRLVSGGEAQWAPSGDAVLFSSPRSGASTESHVMRLPFDKTSGRPLGPPRQVTLDEAFGFGVSPDGRQVAYATGRIGYSTSLRVLPVTGGTTRTVLDLPGAIIPIRWGSDGEFLYYLHWPDIQVPKAFVMRVPAQGGEPEQMSAWDDWIRLSTHGQYLYRDLPSGDTEKNRYEVADVAGRPLATFNLPRPFALAGFGDGPDELFVVRQDVVNPLRVVPVAGGPVLRLNEAWGYDVPLGWTPAGHDVFFATELNGEQIFMFAPVDGGPMRQVSIPENRLPGWRVSLSSDGQRVLYYSAGQEEGEEGIWVYDIPGDTAFQVDEGRIPPGTTGGRWSIGGQRGGGGFLYGLTRNGRHELMEARPDGSTHTLWTFPDRGEEPPTVRVHGDLIAYTTNDGEEGSLFIARVGENAARRVLTLPGSIGTRGSNPPAWAPNGRFLAVSYAGTEEDRRRQVLLVEATEAGQLAGEPSFLSLEGGPSWWYSLTWLPDSQHFLIVGGTEEAPLRNGVWLVSTDPETPPLNVTAEVEGTIWGFVLSPDGRYIAVESEIPRGSSVWRVTLGDILSGRAGPER